MSAKDNGKIMLWQIKKILNCYFSDLTTSISSLPDPRTGIEYSIAEVMMAAIMLFLLKCDSRNDFNNKRKDEEFRKNYYRMFRLRLPHMDAVNDMFKNLCDNKMEEIRCRFINSLIEKRVFHKFRFFDKYFYIAIDGTGVYNWGDSPPENIAKHATQKKYDSGKVNYSSQILEAVLVCKNGIKIPLISEWIANESGKNDKQDCELEAFKRLSVRLKNYFPRLNICLLTDGLYTKNPLFDICKQYDWKFITVFKDGNLPSVWEEVESLLPLTARECSCKQQQFAGNYWITRNFQWIKKIEYQKHHVNWIRCIQEKEHSETKEKDENTFVFLTNFDVDRQNIAAILLAGRARWHIEDLFNTLKNRGGALHHKFSRNDFNALKIWHSVRQLVYMMLELLTHTSDVLQMKDKYKITWKELWKNLNAYLSMCSIDEMMEQFEIWILSSRQVRLE